MYCFTAKTESSEPVRLVASNWDAAEKEAIEKFPNDGRVLLYKTVYRIVSVTPHLLRYGEKVD